LLILARAMHTICQGTLSLTLKIEDDLGASEAITSSPDMFFPFK